MKRIKCSNPECERVFAHLLDEGTIDIGRLSHKFTTLGESFTLIGTCPQCPVKTTLVVRNGKLDDSNLTFKEETPNGKETQNNEENGSNGDGNPDPDNSDQSSNDPNGGTASGEPTDTGTGGDGEPAPDDSTSSNGDGGGATIADLPSKRKIGAKRPAETPKS